MVASKKGIAITAIIAIAVIGSSFLIWYIPQQGSTTNITRIPGDYGGILSDVYGSHTALADNIDSKFAQWVDEEITSEEMSSEIDSAQTETARLADDLGRANPSPEWQESYSNYSRSLESFEMYLAAMEQNVAADDRAVSAEMESHKRASADYIEQSIQSFPVNQ